MRARYNLVLHRLVRAVRPENKHIFVEQAISSDAVRPDLVVVDRTTKDTVVIDVTVPYEADRDAFEKARAEKIQKYSTLISWTSTQQEYRNPKFHAFVVGSLGAWSPANSAIFRPLGMSQSYAKLFSHLCCIDAIKGSHAIWNSHKAT